MLRKSLFLIAWEKTWVLANIVLGYQNGNLLQPTPVGNVDHPQRVTLLLGMFHKNGNIFRGLTNSIDHFVEFYYYLKEIIHISYR